MDARKRVEVEILKINRQLQASAGTSTVEPQYVAGKVNLHTFFSVLPDDVTRNIIRPMLFTPAPDDSTKPGFTPHELTAFMATIATDRIGDEICKQFGYSLEEILYQAIIDDHRDLVEAILEKNPGLLLALRQNWMIIQSQYTWQTFKISPNESPLTVAAKRHQIEMIKLLLPYYEQLIQDGQLSEESRQYASAAKEAGLKAWSVYTMTKNADNQDEIVIPPEYSSVINKLIDVFRVEIPMVGRQLHQRSENLERAMRSFLDWLVPESAVELDKHIDVELLLLAAYQIYEKRFNDFTSNDFTSNDFTSKEYLSEDRRSSFCVRVIGLIQSALSPETAKIFCQGLYGVVEKNWQVRDCEVSGFKLCRGESYTRSFRFYRESRESLSGLAGAYFCDDNGKISLGARWGLRWCGLSPVSMVSTLKKLYQTKESTVQSFIPSRQQSCRPVV